MLNEHQEQACCSPASTVVILAGPGSGKTRVITKRVAWLVRERQVPASSIVLVTFTNKAATEMKERVQSIVGEKCAGEVVMGTFHAIASRFLRRHGSKIGISSGFTIYEAGQALGVLRDMVKDLPGCEGLDPRELQTAISHIKSMHGSRAAVHQHIRNIDAILAAYNDRLADRSALDFDDLLLQCRELFLRHPATMDGISHVLVDEFQDTNGMQYELVKLLAHRGALTVVGDPDQSIYGWRQADASIFQRVRQDFPQADVVRLVQSYRSTTSILTASDAVLNGPSPDQHGGRLWTSNGAGPPVVFLGFPSEEEEALAVATEIERVHRMLPSCTLSDFAILLRTNYMSKPFEKVFCKVGIPYRVVGGTKLLDRQEAKDLIAYLRIICSLDDDEAFTRAVNVPKRGIGPAFLETLRRHAGSEKKPMLTVARSECRQTPALRRVKMSPAVVNALSDFIGLVDELHAKAADGAPAADTLQAVLARTNYVEAIKAASEDIVSGVESLVQSSDDQPHPGTTPLAAFLQSLAPFEGDEAGGPAVVLSTIHAAKGLEYGCVFIPGLQDGLLPHERALQQLSQGQSNEIEEERRLLFVAMTRARTMLHLSWSSQRSSYGCASAPCRFLTPLLLAAGGAGQKRKIISQEPMADSVLHASLEGLKSGSRQALVQRSSDRIMALVTSKIDEYRSSLRAAAAAGGTPMVDELMMQRAKAAIIRQPLGEGGFQKASSLLTQGSVLDNSGLQRGVGSLAGQSISSTRPQLQQQQLQQQQLLLQGKPRGKFVVPRSVVGGRDTVKPLRPVATGGNVLADGPNLWTQFQGGLDEEAELGPVNEDGESTRVEERFPVRGEAGGRFASANWASSRRVGGGGDEDFSFSSATRANALRAPPFSGFSSSRSLLNQQQRQEQQQQYQEHQHQHAHSYHPSSSQLQSSFSAVSSQGGWDVRTVGKESCSQSASQGNSTLSAIISHRERHMDRERARAGGMKRVEVTDFGAHSFVCEGDWDYGGSAESFLAPSSSIAGSRTVSLPSSRLPPQPPSPPPNFDIDNETTFLSTTTTTTTATTKVKANVRTPTSTLPSSVAARLDIITGAGFVDGGASFNSSDDHATIILHSPPPIARGTKTSRESPQSPRARRTPSKAKMASPLVPKEEAHIPVDAVDSATDGASDSLWSARVSIKYPARDSQLDHQAPIMSPPPRGPAPAQSANRDSMITFPTAASASTAGAHNSIMPKDVSHAPKSAAPLSSPSPTASSAKRKRLKEPLASPPPPLLSSISKESCAGGNDDDWDEFEQPWPGSLNKSTTTTSHAFAKKSGTVQGNGKQPCTVALAASPYASAASIRASSKPSKAGTEPSTDSMGTDSLPKPIAAPTATAPIASKVAPKVSPYAGAALSRGGPQLSQAPSAPGNASATSSSMAHPNPSPCAPSVGETVSHNGNKGKESAGESPETAPGDASSGLAGGGTPAGGVSSKNVWQTFWKSMSASQAQVDSKRPAPTPLAKTGAKKTKAGGGEGGGGAGGKKAGEGPRGGGRGKLTPH